MCFLLVRRGHKEPLVNLSSAGVLDSLFFRYLVTSGSRFLAFSLLLEMSSFLISQLCERAFLPYKLNIANLKQSL